MADDEDRVDQLARKLLHGTDEDEQTITDIESARRVARVRLEDSDARTFDPAVTDQENPGVIRRDSEEAAQNPEGAP